MAIESEERSDSQVSEGMNLSGNGERQPVDQLRDWYKCVYRVFNKHRFKDPQALQIAAKACAEKALELTIPHKKNDNNSNSTPKSESIAS